LVHGRQPKVADVSSDEREIGVGPLPKPWPEDPRFDTELLAKGDQRNVTDSYRYWSVEAIKNDLDSRRHSFHVAIENWVNDNNIGSVVRTANAFLAREVHLIGRKRWNRRGAMGTELYQHLRHHQDVDEFFTWVQASNLPVIGIDNSLEAVSLEHTQLPKSCVLLFGQEGSGLSKSAREICISVLAITQFGSTRSMNAGAAAAIAMHTWVRQHGL
jgi:tRNA G18 (ribose-2'-O)-methylase SpoU